jgi:predicted nucleotidyltransferase
LRERERRWRELLEEASRWARELAGKLEAQGIRVLEVKLFGSIARGDWASESDLDLLIISPDWPGEYTRRLSILYKLWDKPRDAHFIPLKPQELPQALERSVALRDASRYWVTIYHRGGAQAGGGEAQAR